VADSSLRLELAEKLRSLQLDSIRVRVRHGVVRVTGAFQEANQREIILSTICSTPGVKGVDDLMQMEQK
jgi:osmotically-inducible protein OsmY